MLGPDTHTPSNLVNLQAKIGPYFLVTRVELPGLQLVSLLYRKTSNISRTLVGNKIVDNSDVVGASPVGAAPTTSSFST